MPKVSLISTAALLMLKRSSKMLRLLSKTSNPKIPKR